MIGEFQIRVGEASDLANVIMLERSAGEAPHWRESDYVAITDGQANEEPVRRRLFVAERGGRLLGFAVGKMLSATHVAMGELESVVVDRASRRLGLGRGLCHAVIRWCRSQGATELELEVRAGSAGAMRLYESLGFALVGRRSSYYQDPTEDALLMELKLGSVEKSTLPFLI